MESVRVGTDPIPSLGLPAFDGLSASAQAVALGTSAWGLVKPGARPTPLTACLNEAAAVPWAWGAAMLDRDRTTDAFMFTLQPLQELLYELDEPVPDYEAVGEPATAADLQRLVAPLVDRVSWKSKPAEDAALGDVSVSPEVYEAEVPDDSPQTVETAVKRMNSLLLPL